MRFALITLPDTNSPIIRVGAKTRPQLQAEFAIALGCKRIFLFCASPTADAFSLQTFCETAGCKVQLIRDAKPLLAAVKAEDSVLVLSPEIVPLSKKAAEILSGSPVVLAIDADDAEAESYERIDINHRWAGALTIPGKLAAKIADLPQDVELSSALLRLALQGRIPLRQLSDREMKDARWSTGSHSAPNAVVTSPDRTTASDCAYPITDRMAQSLVAKAGAAASEKGVTPFILTGATSLLSIVAVGVSLLDLSSALLLTAFAWFVSRLVTTFEDYLRTPFAQEKQSLFKLLSWVIDGALVLTLAISPIVANGTDNWPIAVFAAFTLGLAMQIADRTLPATQRGLVTDRSFIALLIAAAGLVFNLQPSLFAICSALLLLALWSLEFDKDNRELTEAD